MFRCGYLLLGNRLDMLRTAFVEAKYVSHRATDDEEENREKDNHKNLSRLKRWTV